MTRPRFDIKPISLPGGWSGRVLMGCHDVSPYETVHLKLPTHEQWRSQLTRLADDPTSLPGHKLLKYSKDGEVFRARLAAGDGSIDVIGKQSQTRGFRRRLARALKLLAIGVNTALPLATIERRRPRREAWLVTACIPDPVDLDHVALQLLPRLERQRVRSVKDAITSAIVELLVRLQRNNFTHRDLKASNILLTNWDGLRGYVVVWLVDLDGLQLLPRVGATRRWQSVIRLAASLLSYSSITRSDYGRFLKTYMERIGSPRKEWKRRYRDLAQRAGAYVRCAARRKFDKLDGFTGEG